MISQPRYLPAINYLQRIHQCDIFIILDTVQHNRQDFEHRNRIAGQHGPRWLSLPLDRGVGSRPALSKLQLLTDDCIQQHCETILATYRQAKYFNEALIKSLYEPVHTTNFVAVLVEMLQRTFQLLGEEKSGKQQWLLASSLPVDIIKGPEYLVRLCHYVGASHYISGPNGRDYIGSEFAAADLKVSYHQDAPPDYERGAQYAIPWLAWIDALHHQGDAYVSEIIHKPLTLSC